ncbi:12391_t:CDS:10, partial [Gigaspora rosea]
EKTSPVKKTQKTLFSFLGLPTPSTSRLDEDDIEKCETQTREQEPSSPDTPATPTTDKLNASLTSSTDIDGSSSEKESEEPTVGRRTLRGRVKRKIIISSDEESEDVVSSPLQKEAPSRRKKTKKNGDDEYNGDTCNEDSDDAAISDVVEESDYDDKKSRSKNTKKTVNKTNKTSGNLNSAQNKLKAFASNSAIRRGSSFSSTIHMTNSEKKKQRASDFKAKNEERYSWLQEVRDADGNLEGSPDYDSRTLFIPRSAWDKFTPFEKQFWEIKSKHWDTRDADIGHKEFDLKLTDRVNMRMVGVPEMAFESWAAQFIAKGHKVAKVDQMETALGKEMREKASNVKEDRIIRRELTSVFTAGTIVEGGLLTNEMSTYCMSIKESCPTENAPPAFGICFVDTATAEFHLASFLDDVDRTQFETLIMQTKPKEIIYEKGMLSQLSKRILKDCTNRPIWTALKPESEFWDANTTRSQIRMSRYFSNNQNTSIAQNEVDNEGDVTMIDNDEGNKIETWPSAIQEALKDPLMLSALGGLLWYLRSLKLDAELVSLQNFHIYDPICHNTSLVLDGQTLANLEVFENSLDGSTQGTVFQLLNRCITPFGKRTFKQWLCHPLRDIAAINARLDAIEELNTVPDFQDIFLVNFSHFPDLERLISRIHAGTCKVRDFLHVLTSFEKLTDTMEKLGGFANDFKSIRLKQLFESFPDLKPMLTHFNKAFDHEKAYKEGNLLPYPGVESDYDEIINRMAEVNKQLDGHLEDSKKLLKTSKIVYKDIGKELFQLEVPNTIKVPDHWQKLSRTQKVNRYWNPTLQKLIRDFQEAKETQSSVLKSLQSRFYQKFDAHYRNWLLAVKIVGEIDCLLSLAKSSLALGEPRCRPQFVSQEQSILEFEELRHPCFTAGAAFDFIPNDTFLGGDQPNMILLTGPNMGGKSTLLRQNCVAIIMAQLGCYVPAKHCRMTPFDRIYTRIGANDNILAGQSTFMVELSETSKIIHEATPRSMVILDELGRGTSTFDGYAIAYSVLHYLATHIGCLGLFSTHYGMLTQEFAKNPNIALKHMSCHVDQDRKEVTFLYKLVPGVCPKSYGMNVANMAGVPRQIVDRAEVVAAKFEQTSKLQDILTANSSNLPITTLCDFVYLLKSAARNGDSSKEIDGGALDNRADYKKEERYTRVLKTIIRGIKLM